MVRYVAGGTARGSSWPDPPPGPLAPDRSSTASSPPSPSNSTGRLDHVTARPPWSFRSAAGRRNCRAWERDRSSTARTGRGWCRSTRWPGRRLLHGQLPQVGLRPEGRGVPPRPPGPAAGDPSAGPISHGANDPRPGARGIPQGVRLDRGPWIRHPHPRRPGGARGRRRADARRVAGRHGPQHRPGPRRPARAGGGGRAPAALPRGDARRDGRLVLPPDRGFAERVPPTSSSSQGRLREAFAIEVPVHPWPRDPGPGERRHRLVRVSAHLHNDPAEYAYLAEALRKLLAEEERG